MTKSILLMTCALGALTLSGQAAFAAAAAAPSANAIGEVVVTAQRKQENLQSAPIAVSAFSSASLSSKKLQGGQDLLLQIPNANYTRTNFGGFSFAIRGIGSQVISASGQAGVAINENELPVTANNFANSEFFDVQRVEVVRGPVGTLYGRSATGGAVNVITNMPSDTFGGFGTVSYGNYNAIRVTGAVNIPLGEAFALRIAGMRYAQDGYGMNTYLGQRVDGRDLGAVRATLRFKPSDKFDAYLMFEHYGEDDNRNRIGKQLCIKDPGPSSVGIAGQGVGVVPIAPAGGPVFFNYAAFLNQGCLPGSLYQPAAYGTVNSNATFLATGNLVGLNDGTDVFANNPLQDRNLHNIQSPTQPIFKSNEDLVELHLAWHVTDNLTLTSITGFNHATGYTQEDYNRIIPNKPFTPSNTAFPAVIGQIVRGEQLAACSPNCTPTQIAIANGTAAALANLPLALFPNGVVNDPQIGPSNKLTTVDYGNANSKEYTQELRLTSSFKGKFNFSAGLFYSEATGPSQGQGTTNYYVASNALTAAAIVNNALGGAILGGPIYIDPKVNPDGSGHNYYDARTGGGYLKSYAAFGEVYYDITPSLKLTLGGRYTADRAYDQSYPISVLVATPNGTTPINQGSGPAYAGFPPGVCTTSLAQCLTPRKFDTNKFTGRANLEWTPVLSFTDKTIIYASYARGYKGGGFNTPCQVGLGTVGTTGNSCPYALTFAPETINAYEIGTKNTLLGGAMTLNLTGFYYDYKGYQISTIVAKSSVNQNINAKIYGAELESVWSPVRDLTLNANIGYLHSSIDSGQFQNDQMNLTQGNPNYTLLHGADGTACLAPSALLAAYIAGGSPAPGLATGFIGTTPTTPGLTSGLCGQSSNPSGSDYNPYQFGIPANLSGKKLPNTPDWTVSAGAQYVVHFANDWKATLRGDYYWQADSFARIFNAVNDQLRSYHVVNSTLTLANAPMGVDVQLYVKNVFNAQPITGVYLTNDTSGLFQNVFTLDPRTYGVQVTKKF